MVLGRHLPLLGFSRRGLSRRLFQPAGALDPHMSLAVNKPAFGLWTCPALYSKFDGHLMGTAWSVRAKATSISLLRAKRNARVVVIDNVEHARQARDRWPARDVHELERVIWGADRRAKASRLDWVTMRRDVDAVCMTTNGVAETKFMDTGFGRERGDQLHFWGWDVPTVVFLNPAFYIGPHVRVDPADPAADAAAAELAEILRLLAAGDEAKATAAMERFAAARQARGGLRA